MRLLVTQSNQTNSDHFWIELSIILDSGFFPSNKNNEWMNETLTLYIRCCLKDNSTKEWRAEPNKDGANYTIHFTILAGFVLINFIFTCFFAPNPLLFVTVVTTVVPHLCCQSNENDHNWVLFVLNLFWKRKEEFCFLFSSHNVPKFLYRLRQILSRVSYCSNTFTTL